MGVGAFESGVVGVGGDDEVVGDGVRFWRGYSYLHPLAISFSILLTNLQVCLSS